MNPIVAFFTGLGVLAVLTFVYGFCLLVATVRGYSEPDDRLAPVDALLTIMVAICLVVGIPIALGYLVLLLV